MGQKGRMLRLAMAALAVASALGMIPVLNAGAAHTKDNRPTTYTHTAVAGAPRGTSGDCDPTDTYCYNGKGAPAPGRVDCSISNYRCTDIAADMSYKAYGHYVGHDEPSTPFYSTVAGSGGQSRWQLQIPSDPPTQPTASNGVTWNFMLHPAFWFGMALCNDMSYPEVHTQIGACTPNSDSNIADCADPNGVACAPGAGGWIGNHVGGAYMEFQFYPPGWAPLIGNSPVGGESCDPVKWCAAMVIWSLQMNGDFSQNNADCVRNSNGGVEFGNASFITFTGHSPTPASPYKNPNAFSPNPASDMYFNSGDNLVVSMNDIPDSSPGPNGSGLQIVVNDLSTGQTGSTVASGTGPNNNGFTTLKWAPNDATCTVIPYNFHPMYSTSGLHTRIPWAAHTYNIDFTDEVGHFDYCSHVTINNSGDGGCGSALAPASEGPVGDQETAEQPPAGSFGDDSVCYDGTTPGTTTLVPLSGCIGSNNGFDGSTYRYNTWPDGNFSLRPTPIRFTSPLTGPNYDTQYSDYAFEANTPALEFSAGIVPPFGAGYTASPCNILTGGTGCTWQPPTDDSKNVPPGQPIPQADYGFYPWFSVDQHNASQCWWLLGQDVAGQTSNDFNNGISDSQYGPPYNVPYQQGQTPTPYALILAENFHTQPGNSTNPAFVGFANSNSCPAAIPTVPSSYLPVAPTASLLAIAGAGAVGAVTLIRRRRRATTTA